MLPSALPECSCFPTISLTVDAIHLLDFYQYTGLVYTSDLKYDLWIAASLGNMLEMQILRLHTRTTESETGNGAQQSPDKSDVHPNLKNTVLISCF